MFILRKLGIEEVRQGKDEFTCPIVCKFKSLNAIRTWARGIGLYFVKDRSLYGGYYRDIQGDCYFVHKVY